MGASMLKVNMAYTLIKVGPLGNTPDSTSILMLTELYRICCIYAQIDSIIQKSTKSAPVLIYRVAYMLSVTGNTLTDTPSA